jgi:hypothetical protein
MRYKYRTMSAEFHANGHGYGGDFFLFSKGGSTAFKDVPIGTLINIGVPFVRDLVKSLRLDTPDADIALEQSEPVNIANAKVKAARSLFKRVAPRRGIASVEGDD